MITKIQKWGNSLGIRIPKEIALKTHVSDGSMVLLSVEKGTIVLSRSKKPRYSLSGLLKNFNKKNSAQAG